MLCQYRLANGKLRGEIDEQAEYLLEVLLGRPDAVALIDLADFALIDVVG